MKHSAVADTQANAQNYKRHFLPTHEQTNRH